MFRRSLTVFASVAAVLSALSACSNSKPPPFETVDDAFARLVHRSKASMPADVNEPATYTIAFDRYATATGSNQVDRHVVLGTGARKRRALNPMHLVRTVTRPFDESIGRLHLRRRLGFVTDQPNGKSRVVLLRPLPDDARPRLYPLPRTDTVGVVAGRTCALEKDARGTYCVDAAGLVLASDDGNTVDVATRVTTRAAPTTPMAIAAQLAQGFTDPGAGSVRPIDAGSSPPGQPDFALGAAPDGFTLVGRYAVVAFSDALLTRSSHKIAAGIVDVYVRGGDSIVVDRGGRLDKSDVTDHDLGSLADQHPVDLGVLGAGLGGIGGSVPFGYREVRFMPAPGRYVVVAGTVPLDELIALTRTLKASPGTQLTYTDKLPPN